jgi:hypothetical protein
MSPLRWPRLLGLAMILAGAAFAAERPLSEAEGSASHPRERLFNVSGTVRVPDVLKPEARWTVLFVPRIESCSPQEIEVVRALARLTKEFSDLEVATLIPEHTPSGRVGRGVFGLPFPGSVARTSTARWQQEERIAPRPRIEVWSGRGELLLMRSIPSSVSEQAIYEEVLWARAFTSPVSEEP